MFYSEFSQRLIEQRTLIFPCEDGVKEAKAMSGHSLFSKFEWISSQSNCTALKLVGLPNSLPSDSPLKPSVWEHTAFSVCFPFYPFTVDALWPEK